MDRFGLDIVARTFGETALKTVAEWSTDPGAQRFLTGIHQIQLFQEDASNAIAAITLFSAEAAVSLSVAPYDMGLVPRQWMLAREQGLEAFNREFGTELSWTEGDDLPRLLLVREYFLAARELLEWLRTCDAVPTGRRTVWLGNDVDRVKSGPALERRIQRRTRAMSPNAIAALAVLCFECHTKREGLIAMDLAPDDVGDG